MVLIKNISMKVFTFKSAKVNMEVFFPIRGGVLYIMWGNPRACVVAVMEIRALTVYIHALAMCSRTICFT